MYLVADNSSPKVVHDDGPSFARWENYPISHLSHHGQPCCEVARRWFGAMDFAQLNGNDLMSGPRWIRHKFEWGPSRWPLHWCEALDAKAIDCGAHAGLAEEAFEARGLTTLRAQVVQSYGGRAVHQWQLRWGKDDASQHWLGDGLIYHEVNAVVSGPEQVKVWDGSSGCWLNPEHISGYGSVVAIRLTPGAGADGMTAPQWGTHRLSLNSWQSLAAA